MSADTDSNRFEKRDNGRFRRGGPGGPGRKPGTPNKATTDGKRVKAAILASWDEVDGPAILRKLARENPAEFLRLLVKVLPREIEAEVSTPTTVASVFAQAQKREEDRRLATGEAP